MKIGEVAETSGISAKMFRYHESTGRIAKAVRWLGWSTHRGTWRILVRAMPSRIARSSKNRRASESIPRSTHLTVHATCESCQARALPANGPAVGKVLQIGSFRRVAGRLLLFGTITFAGAFLDALPSVASTAEGVSAYNAGDYHAALDMLRDPAREGDRVAQYYLGLIFTYGRGIAADPRVGVTWYEMAAEQNYAPAAAELGIAYLQGEGVAKDYDRARNWLERAALNGSADAAYNLGTLYKDGRGVSQNIETAFYWYTWSIRSGLSDDAHELGLLYLDHGSEARHRVLGYMWILIAVQDGDMEAIGDVKRFRLQLSPAERDEATRLAKEWPR